MNAHDLVDWIDKNYPRLSPYLEVGNPSDVRIYLDKKLRAGDLGIARFRRSSCVDGDKWWYTESGGIYIKCGQVDTIVRGNQTIDDVSDKMKLICEGCLKKIEWYERFPIEEDRAQLIDLGMDYYYGALNGFCVTFPDADMRVDIELPSADRRRYMAQLQKLHGKSVTMYASTLDKLLDKIMKGGE